MSSLLDTFQGLPVHPLVVHFAVVLLPLATFSTMISVFIPRYRKSYAFASVVGVFLGTGAAVVAKQSGEALSARVGLPQEHANYGDKLPLLAAAFFLLALLWYRRWKATRSNRIGPLGYLVAVIGLAVLLLTYLTGHSGATAVWQGKISTSNSETSTDQNSQDTGKTSAGYTLKEIAQHKDSKSCWSAIDGNVYDLTSWITQHPGGAGVIKGMCGKDGTAAYNSQHRGQGRPASELARFKIGSLK